MNFETLPDELILLICRYLSSSDIIYSLFNLNSRLNRTIFIYRQHVILRLTSYNQFEYLCLNVLPKIGSTIRSLTINTNWTDLIAKRFYFYFGERMKEIFPNIEHLTLVAFSGSELNDYMISISDLIYLKQLTIQDRYNITEEYKQVLFDKILSANNNRLEKIFFNRHSESLSINPINSIVYSNIIQLNVHLEKITDLQCLMKLIPNIHRMNIVIDNQSDDIIINFHEEFILKYLTEFHLESFRRNWIFDEIYSLLKQMPFLQTLSLDLFSQDFRLSNGQHIVPILPINTLQNLNYAIEYEPEVEIESIENIISSWTSTPYPISCLSANGTTQIFLHTIPYNFPYLDINSSYAKRMNKKLGDYSHRIKELLLFNVSTLAETFIAISNCVKIKDLALEIGDEPSEIIEDERKEKENILLPCLNKLHWLSIDGCPPDVHLLKEILIASPNLSLLVIDMKYLLRLFDIEDNQSCLLLLKNRIRNLSIQIEDEAEMNDLIFEKLSKIFIHIRHIIVEIKLTNGLSIENFLLFFFKYFQNHQLISIIVRGCTTEQLRNNPSQWLIDHTHLNTFTNQFQADCDDVEFKIWF
ncbi:unnamed protein product [Adineta steineri]|uniref:F-box domain-containing protein n=1 Tax=Adineta steineri TaxID=433720 RepID=A0A819JQF3_9BILA|nr:unnamed protein product [Adineta steineri]CAF3936769.1 unnamed protein product [Adineta steineri]